jgi:phosphomannomutase/phosphoglucomutase
MEIVSKSGKPISAQLAGLPKMVSTPEIRIDCPDDAKFQVVKQVAEYFRGKRKTIDIDGARVIFEHGWGLLRASNTQPVLVMRFEAENAQLLAEYRHEVESAMENARRGLAGTP